MLLVAIDPATVTGMAIYGDVYSNPSPIRWTWIIDTPANSYTARADLCAEIKRALCLLDELRLPSAISLVVREQAFRGQHLMTLGGRIEQICSDGGFPYVDVSNSDWKKWLIGKGNASKEQVYDAVRERGWCPNVERTERGFNETDAAGICEWARHVAWPAMQESAA